MNLTLGKEEVGKAIEVYLMIKGYATHGTIQVNTSYGKITNTIVNDVRPFDVDLDKLAKLVRDGTV